MSKTDKDKSDYMVGKKVKEHLISLGIETPMRESIFSSAQAKSSIQASVQDIMTTLGLDLFDDSLCDTPARVAKMFVNELFWGLDYDNFPKATVVSNKMGCDEMVLERRITVHSTCEHHLLPILGSAHVAYIPNALDKGGTVLGLSKLNRIVEFFSRRPQIQERLTLQIASTLKFLLETDNVAVCIDAEHLCVKTRGVEDACSDTVTSSLSGVFKSNASARAEFFSLINVNR